MTKHCDDRDRSYHPWLKDSAWRTAHFIGYQDDGDGGFLELRRCPICGTTLSCPKEESQPSAKKEEPWPRSSVSQKD